MPLHFHQVAKELFSISVLISFREILRCFGHSPCVYAFIRKWLFSSINNPTTFVIADPDHLSIPSYPGFSF
jgi:hypothetical protein